MKITIEKAEIKDAVSFGDIEQILYAQGGWKGEMFFKDMNENNRLYLVAKDKEQIIGFIGTSYFLETADILRVAVLPEYQKKGVATQLFNEAIFRLKKLRVERIMLEVEDSNIKAQGLYKKVGFKLISTRKNYYGNGKNGLIYELEITK